jgi:hypothetical protein
MTNNDKVASIRFSGVNHDTREAERIFKLWKEQSDPDDPENPDKHMGNQMILVKALIALGVPEQSSTDNADPVLTAIERLEGVVSNIGDRISRLAEQGIITHSQAEEVNKAVDLEQITKDFAANQAKSLKPGRRPGKS